ncbi:hypothetical protein HDE_11674 [Halotydeus destructor]|nr:hypothetical protein HDE_11674 [Halotydeus destructor]
MKVVDILITFVKWLWKWTKKVLGVLFHFLNYFPIRISLYSVFIYVGFLWQSYDTGDTYSHESVTKYDATINLLDIFTPIMLLRLPVRDLFDIEEESMTINEIFNKTPSAEDFIGKCGVHNRTGYGEIPDCVPSEQFTVTKFLEKDMLGYAFELKNSTIPFQGYHVYNGGIPPYLWQIQFERTVIDFLKQATLRGTLKVYVHLFISYVTSFGQGVTEPYGMTEMRWDKANEVVVNGKFSVTYKLRLVTRLEWPMDSDCREYPGSSRGKCMNDCNRLATKRMFREGDINETLPLNFRLYESDKMFYNLTLALPEDYKRDEINSILDRIFKECRDQCQRRECAETLIEPTVVAATGSTFSGVRLYAPNKPTIKVLEEEKMTFGQMIVGILSIAGFWFPDLHLFTVVETYWPIILAHVTVMLAALLDHHVRWFRKHFTSRRVSPISGSNVIILREGAIEMAYESEVDLRIPRGQSVDSELTDTEV